MSIQFELNDKDVAFDGSPMTRLLEFLREDCRLTGTKEGCGEGECGACSILLDDDIACACLVPMLQVGGRRVRTIEAMAKVTADRPILDTLQDAFVREGGVQCGACTPGILMTMRALLDKEPQPSRARIREALGGNLCRCTGYERVFRAVEAAFAGEADRP